MMIIGHVTSYTSEQINMCLQSLSLIPIYLPHFKFKHLMSKIFAFINGIVFPITSGYLMMITGHVTS